MGEESRSQLASKYTPQVCNEYSNKTFMQRAYYRMFPYYHILGFYFIAQGQINCYKMQLPLMHDPLS